MGLGNSDDVFEYIINKLVPTVNSWSYLVDWNKAQSNLRRIEMNLNTMNYLIGKDNVAEEFSMLLKENPSVKQVLPILVACRDKSFTIVTEYDENCMRYSEYNFNEMTDEQALEFAIGSGVLDLFQSTKIKSLVDYVFGIEVGLGSNGRKNRSGTAMENMMEFHISNLCIKSGIEYIPVGSSSSVRRKWGIDLAVDKTDRELDFIVKNEDVLYLIEVNYYSGPGSKLKSTAGEYKAIHDFWIAQGYRFVWITDGFGWKSTQKPLREAFDKLDYVLNIQMVYDGILEHIISNKL